MNNSPTDPDRLKRRSNDESRTLPLGPEAGSAPVPEETASFHPQGAVSAEELPSPSLAAHPVPAALVNHPRYAILEFLGSGGMGTVYKARHRLMDRIVALKIISVDLVNRPIMVERFRREVKAAARLSHPNIVAAFDAEQAGDTHFLVMEYVEGVDLDRVLQVRGRLAATRACEYARQTALGLQHAHERGMVHRDIKPHNLMLTAHGQIKILDFGLARFRSEMDPSGFRPASSELSSLSGGQEHGDEATLPENPVRILKGTAYAYTGAGTADYIAPEEAVDARSADIRADIYSLGCTLYRFLAGRVPFPEGDLIYKVRSHLERSPESLCGLRSELPSRLCDVVERMMAKDPADRYQTPADVADALLSFAVPTPRPILIVDDDALTRSAMTTEFESRGYPTTSAANGQEALCRLREGETPSLIVLDLLMPVMDGWEFLQKQRQDPILSTIPVVIVSAADAEQARAVALGAAACLRKPLAPEELTARVQEYVLPPC